MLVVGRNLDSSLDMGEAALVDLDRQDPRLFVGLRVTALFMKN